MYLEVKKLLVTKISQFITNAVKTLQFLVCFSHKRQRTFHYLFGRLHHLHGAGRYRQCLRLGVQWISRLASLPRRKSRPATVPVTHSRRREKHPPRRRGQMTARLWQLDARPAEEHGVGLGTERGLRRPQDGRCR